MTKQVNVYPGKASTAVEHSDSSRGNLGLCFSGGGSRALTCAWGQLLGLDTLGLMEKPRYISSVSGGTWASCIYTFLPQNYSDQDLLGQYFKPADLSLKDAAGKLNLDKLGEKVYGNIPAGLDIYELLVTAGQFITENRGKNSQWLWADIIASKVLDHYDLRSKGEASWLSTRSFSLSQDYAQATFPQLNPSDQNFYYVRPKRPFIVMNNNIMQKVDDADRKISNIVQLPDQVTPVASGVRGETPDKAIVGGGLVESWGFASDVEQTDATQSPVSISLKQNYSLIDIASTSSAFFAQAIASFIQAHLKDEDSKKGLLKDIEARLSDEHKKGLLHEIGGDIKDIFDAIGAHLENYVLSSIGNVVPRYNYWPVTEDSKNEELLFTDGGTLENTGILGAIAQTDTGEAQQQSLHLLAFDNTSTPLTVNKGKVISAGQAAPLFGINFNEKTGVGQPFTAEQKDPTNSAFIATSLIQIFDNTPDNNGVTPFEQLVKGLYTSSAGVAADAEVTSNDSWQPQNPAYHQMSVTTVANALSGISAGRSIELFYVQNGRMMNWQDQLVDTELKDQILAGQGLQSDLRKTYDDITEAVELYFKARADLDKEIVEILKQPQKSFADFPYYNTFLKIGLLPKESNALSQMWAWAVCDEGSPMRADLEQFIAAAK
ncbi:hypothetical protein [Oceanospirillum beijerinckii]|uniref:hypothetical protein n=1 Tax=Oceanospirillum beijerinckii TaxID=64976 RepID=UPI0003F71E3E|nr:hypothetical protein [Oceanospirillum beijerinckii]